MSDEIIVNARHLYVVRELLSEKVLQGYLRWEEYSRCLESKRKYGSHYSVIDSLVSELEGVKSKNADLEHALYAVEALINEVWDITDCDPSYGEPFSLKVSVLNAR
jgi:hypothetical protein